MLNAAMQAAYRCEQYQEAAELYKELRNLNVGVDKVSLHVGLKIFGKLQDPGMVDAIRAETSERGWVDKLKCGARIDAAAYMGDVEEAVKVLDMMLTRKIELDVYKFNSAIFACAKAKKSQPQRSHGPISILAGQRLFTDGRDGHQLGTGTRQGKS